MFSSYVPSRDPLRAIIDFVYEPKAAEHNARDMLFLFYVYAEKTSSNDDPDCRRPAARYHDNKHVSPRRLPVRGHSFFSRHAGGGLRKHNSAWVTVEKLNYINETRNTTAVLSCPSA